MAIACNARCGKTSPVITHPGGAPRRTCTLDLALDLSAPRTASALLSLLLEQWGVSDRNLLDGASIVVSELVTNALVHGGDGGTVSLGLDLEGRQLTLSVTDSSPLLPTQRTAHPADEGGRGLSIVGQIATRWGAEPTAGGKRVFAELPLPTTSCA